jgi:hypothetical protein
MRAWTESEVLAELITTRRAIATARAMVTDPTPDRAYVKPPHLDHLGRWAVPARLRDDRRRIGAIVAGDRRSIRKR